MEPTQETDPIGESFGIVQGRPEEGPTFLEGHGPVLEGEHSFAVGPELLALLANQMRSLGFPQLPESEDLTTNLAGFAIDE